METWFTKRGERGDNSYNQEEGVSSVEFTGPDGEPLSDDSSVGDAAWHGGFDMTLDGKQVCSCQQQAGSRLALWLHTCCYTCVVKVRLSLCSSTRHILMYQGAFSTARAHDVHGFIALRHPTTALAQAHINMHFPYCNSFFENLNLSLTLILFFRKSKRNLYTKRRLYPAQTKRPPLPLPLPRPTYPACLPPVSSAGHSIWRLHRG